MLVQEECVEVHALKQRGWSISAIARHLGRDRKTVRAYLLGERVPGERARIGSDPFGGCCGRDVPLVGCGLETAG